MAVQRLHEEDLLDDRDARWVVHSAIWRWYSSASCGGCTARGPRRAPFVTRRRPPRRPGLRPSVTRRHMAVALLMLLLCCNLLSLAEGCSPTVVAWGFHLPSCCHCYVIICHTYVTETTEGTPIRVKRSQQSMETRHAFARFSGLAPFDSRADLPTSAAANTVALHHPACCAFSVFFFSLTHRARRQLCGLLALYYFH